MKGAGEGEEGRGRKGVGKWREDERRGEGKWEEGEGRERR